MKLAYDNPKRENISLLNLTPEEQDILYDALEYYSNHAGFPTRECAALRLSAILDSVPNARDNRNYTGATAFLSSK